MKKNLNSALQYLVIFALALIFIGLGKWQLDRAAQWKELKSEERIVDSRIYSLNDIAQPTDTLTNKQTNKRVSISGHYIATFRAPNQIDKGGVRRDVEVSLMQIGTNNAILVVRGLWADRLLEPHIRMADNITVVGTLQPRQSEDVAPYSDGALQRLDSSLVTDVAPDLNLYDGYIAVQSESHGGTDILRSRFAPPFRSAVTGFYWQHISYVLIWWLMAALMFYLPFYNRRIRRTVQP